MIDHPTPVVYHHRSSLPIPSSTNNRLAHVGWEIYTHLRQSTPKPVLTVANITLAHFLIVITAQTGEMGLQRARFAQPDLILLDVLLPETDGFETCRLLKDHQAVSGS